MNRTVLRTVEILKVISKHGEISLTDLVRITGCPKTGVYDILHALGERAMIYRCTGRVCYDIGFHAYAIGRSYSENSDLLSNSYQCMRALVEDIRKAVLLGKVDGGKILYIARCEPKHPVIMAPSIGDEEPVKNTAFAKIAKMSTYHEKKIYQLSKEEKNHIRTKELASYGLDGPSPFYNIASPIYNFETGLSGVVGVFGVKEVGIDYSEKLKKVRKCAGKISERLRFV